MSKNEYCFIPPKLIEVKKFDSINPMITATRFLVPDFIRNNYKLFPLEKKATSQQIIEDMNAGGYVPANVYESLLWCGWDEIKTVISLEAVVGANGDRRVFVFSRSGSQRSLGLELWSKKWDPSYYFLAVCEN